MAIDFYFDFASPYGFIAAMQIEAIECWALLDVWPVAAGPHHPLKRKYVIEVDAPRMAHRIGLDLKIPANFPEHSLPPSRAFYWIEEQDRAKAVAFAKVVYRRYCLEGSATSDAAVAADAAASIGCDRDAVVAGMQDAPTKSRLSRENEEAICNGVFGSPFFLVDGEPFWGSDRIALLAQR
jgi:2-hydroxychromene-2-carboxylate isomerase